MNGFASRLSGPESFVWVYRKNGHGFEVNTKNVAVGRRFYGNEADEAITAIESSLAAAIRALRKGGASRALVDPLVPQLVAHLSVRTMAVREASVQSAHAAFEVFRQRFTEPRRLRKILDRKLKYELVRLGVPAPKARKLLSKSGPLIHRVVREGIDEIEAKMELIREQLPASMAEGHNKVLTTNPLAKAAADAFGEFCWHTVEVEDAVILGDCVCLFETSEGSHEFYPWPRELEDLTRIILPLSTNLILAGSRNLIPKRVEVERLNEASARCSYEYVISAQPIPIDSPLSAVIGSRSGLISDKEIREIMEDIERTLLRQCSLRCLQEGRPSE